MADVPQIFNEIHTFMQERERVHEAGFDLWTWHPEHLFTQMFHGDYADEVQPSTEWLIRDTTSFVSYLMGYENDQIEQLLLLEAAPPQECYCGEVHAPLDDEKHPDWYGFKRDDAYRKVEQIRRIHEFAKSLQG